MVEKMAEKMVVSYCGWLVGWMGCFLAELMAGCGDGWHVVCDANKDCSKECCTDAMVSLIVDIMLVTKMTVLEIRLKRI